MVALTWHDDIEDFEGSLTEVPLGLELFVCEDIRTVPLHPTVHLGQVVLGSDQSHVVGVQHRFVFLEESFMGINTTLLGFMFVVFQFLRLSFDGSRYIGYFAAREQLSALDFGTGPV